ncbi:Ribose import ATP-binding protein RbsA [Nonomuraea coxensis DSM 45129]|uniref:Ribose import ATP-binding protein RbsA n=1 Tax=Nonomuraea coxensis DSM 45129 TaxID=1122611 RepID=A0ABX8U355_9ACTN|nr:sugar ABC transporter ATP-binding protein [Nonomuraea coxensis]QYC42135.1 Ribose import ATP-binding protein RbsA [Nonomuraea coxensis DSM 45129]
MTSEPAPSPILTVRGISKSYPGTTALNGIDLEARPGEVIALLGENGAGKSTLSGIIAGAIQPTTGTMTWQGRPHAPATPRDSLMRGIGMIHQEMRLLPDLTVAENVAVGRWPTRAGFLSARTMLRQAREQLDKVGFTGRTDQPVRELSVAGQQQVEIAKALMLDASLLILDEPTAALGEMETTALFACIRSLKEQGVSFIYVSHRLAEIAQIADRIVVLRDGEKVAEHDSGDVAPDVLVREMVGRSVDRLFPRFDAPREAVVVSVEGISDRAGRFEDVSFTVRAGEVFGIAGIVGAGRTELVRSIVSLEPRRCGEVRIDGVPLAADDPLAAKAAGVVLIPEDRKQQGVILSDTIEDNIALPNLAAITRWGFVTPSGVTRFARKAAQRFGVKGGVGDPVATLSGGNQQKVVLSKWLSSDPKVIILDEPTRGIDIGARASIYEVVAELAQQGKAIIVVSSDLEEVLGLAHRVMVLAQGRNQGIMEAAEATADRVMAYATQ